MLKLMGIAALACALLYTFYSPTPKEAEDAPTPAQMLTRDSPTPAPSLLARAAMAAGLELPDYARNVSGCFGEMLSEEKLNRFLDVLPGPAGATLASVLAVGEDAWSARLYGDDAGAGLCLPKREIIVRVPGLSFMDLRALMENGSRGGSVQGFVRGLKDSATNLFKGTAWQ